MIKQLTNDEPTPYRKWYNEMLLDMSQKHPNAKVLDVGVGHYWDYSSLWQNYNSIDINGNATINGSILNSGIEDESFDIILCNGMYEYISDVQLMVNEIHRMLKSNGIAIFGFVGVSYKYTGSNGNKYKCEDYFSLLFKKHIRYYNFGSEYYIIYCQKEEK